MLIILNNKALHKINRAVSVPVKKNILFSLSAPPFPGASHFHFSFPPLFCFLHPYFYLLSLPARPLLITGEKRRRWKRGVINGFNKRQNTVRRQLLIPQKVKQNKLWKWSSGSVELRCRDAGGLPCSELVSRRNPEGCCYLLCKLVLPKEAGRTSKQHFVV